MTPPPLSPARGRTYVCLAALIWSTSGAFTKVLTQPTPLGLDDPRLPPEQLACLRTLLAGMVLVLAVRPGMMSFRPLMLVMAGAFAVMNFLFVRATALGTAAEAILLQYTAPMWAFVACVWVLGERADRRSMVSLVMGLAGVVVIIAGGWQNARLNVIAMGLGSGLTYGIVLVSLRVLRGHSPTWMTTINFLVSGLVLLPFILPLDPAPTGAQWVVLFLFGTVQMGIPYFLMARALQSISPQEAGVLSLLELLLNPIWTFAIAGEVPSFWTFLGGAFILAGLLWRYLPGLTQGGQRNEPEA